VKGTEDEKIGRSYLSICWLWRLYKIFIFIMYKL